MSSCRTGCNRTHHRRTIEGHCYIAVCPARARQTTTMTAQHHLSPALSLAVCAPAPSRERMTAGARCAPLDAQDTTDEQPIRRSAVVCSVCFVFASFSFFFCSVAPAAASAAFLALSLAPLRLMGGGFARSGRSAVQGFSLFSRACVCVCVWCVYTHTHTYTHHRLSSLVFAALRLRLLRRVS